MNDGSMDGADARARDGSRGGIRFGLPLWGFRGWAGTLYRASARPQDYLAEYARVHDTVEGNTTFYAVPTPDSVARWCDQTPLDFRFCFKFPRTITHDAGLFGAERQSEAFLERLRPLGPRLGPFMLQLPARFGPAELGVLDGFLEFLPREHDYAVELRHPALFGDTPGARDAEALLHARGCDWIQLDTRGLRAGPEDHPDVRAARHPKPDLPVGTPPTAPHRLVRFVGHPEPFHNEKPLEDWALTLARDVSSGVQVYFFAHCPNDLHAPAIARRARALLSRHLPLDSPPPWPGESSPRQLQLL